MKKVIKTLACMALAVVATGFAVACGGEEGPAFSEPTEYTITFKQEGQADIKITLEKGETLAAEEVPAVKPRTGYTVAWNVHDFSGINDDYTVRAVETPNAYTIYYTLGDMEGATIERGAQSVTYDAAFTLLTPVCEGYDFVGWTYEGAAFAAGTYTVAEDITLVAQWTKDKQDDSWWSDWT